MNQKINNADKNYWSFIPKVSLWHAILLSFDIEPRGMKLWVPTWDPITVHRKNDIFKHKKFSDRFEILKAHVESNNLKREYVSMRCEHPEEWKLDLIEFIKWAKSLNWELPEWLSQLEEKQQLKPTIRGDERKSLHIMIGVLAKKAQIDISKPNAAAETIINLANNELGIEIGKTTVRDHLEKVSKTLSLEVSKN